MNVVLLRPGWYLTGLSLTTLLVSSLAIGPIVAVCSAAGPAEELRVATFCCDVTPPLGQPLFGTDPIRVVEQPLLAKGIVLQAGEERYVLCAVDWCELCNGSHDAWQDKIAAAAGTRPSQVAVQCVHQHNAPLVDIDAQKLLAGVGAAKLHVDPNVLAEIEQRVAAAVRQSLEHLEPFDQIGTGQAKVDRVASYRPCRDATGKIRTRLSYCNSATIRALPEGPIDPYVKTITLARSGKPLVRLHYYATHPQTRYRDGRATSDFVGAAREELQRRENVFQVYFTGCAGDITVGKYNDGTPEGRKVLAGRLLAGMEAAVAATKLEPAGTFRWRTYPLALRARTDAGFTLETSLARMKDRKAPPDNRVYQGAIRAAFVQRIRQPIELSSLQIGNVHILHLPGEPLVCFQFFAQGLVDGRPSNDAEGKAQSPADRPPVGQPPLTGSAGVNRPSGFVAVAGYGDCGPGYICPEEGFYEAGSESDNSCMPPESEKSLKRAIASLLGVD
jgi:hypothetical protein